MFAHTKSRESGQIYLIAKNHGYHFINRSVPVCHNLQWTNVQSSGRCEVLECESSLQDTGDGEVEISLPSSAIINDSRMISRDAGSAST